MKGRVVMAKKGMRPDKGGKDVPPKGKPSGSKKS